MANNDFKKNERIAEYEFSGGLRVTHWARVACIIILTISGFYIAYVFSSPSISPHPDNFMNAKWRAVHQITGFLLIGFTIYKTYLFFFDRRSRGERISLRDVFSFRAWLEVILYYLYIGKSHKTRGFYNPLQFVAYLFFYVVLFVGMTVL